MSGRRPAWLLSLAAFAAGVAVISSGSVPTAKAQPKPAPVVPAPQAPTLTTPANLGVKRGSAAELTLTGTNLADPVAVLLSGPGKATIVEDKKPDAAKVKVKVEVPADAPIGLYSLRLATKHGVSNLRPFVIDELTEVTETDANRTKDAAQAVAAPCVVLGRSDPEASDFFKVKVAAGQRLTFEVLARRIGSPLDPILILHDGKTKRELIDLYADDTPGLQSDCRLAHTFKEAGEVIVEVRDSTYRGGADFHYRLRVGEFLGATTAFPLAAQRGKAASIGFTGPHAADVAAVKLTAPTDPGLAAVYAAPKGKSGLSGWPVPVRLSDHPELVEQEPNDDPKTATKLPVPGGVSARFDKPNDVDHFAVTAKKGQKLVIAAETYEFNSPAEVLIRVLDAKGAELAKSNPTTPAARVEFTPPADGEFVIACEHLFYLHGPNEVYHLSVTPAVPDFAVALALDRYEAPAGGGTAVAVANITRLNGFAGPIELSVEGDKVLGGSITVPPGLPAAWLPLTIAKGAKPGAYPFRVKATATVDGKKVVRYATMTDVVKAALGAMPNPPPELLSGAAAAVADKPPVRLTVTPEGPVEKGKAGKLVVEAVRDGYDADIPLTVAFAPPNVTAAPKPVPKGQAKGEAAVTTTAAATAGANPVVLRAVVKVGGKDYAIVAAPAVVEVIEPKKVEPKKKEEPKKEKKDKP
jgi:hypothetical protein